MSTALAQSGPSIPPHSFLILFPQVLSRREKTCPERSEGAWEKGDLIRQPPGRSASMGMNHLAGKEVPPDQPILPTPTAWKAVLPATNFCDTLRGRGGCSFVACPTHCYR